MQAQRINRKGPKRIWPDMLRGYDNQVTQSVVLFFVEFPYIHKLLLIGIAAKLSSVFQHLGSEPPSDAGKRIKSCRVSKIQICQRYVHIRLKPLIYAVGNDIGAGEILLSTKPSPFLPVIIYSCSLLCRESQTTEVLNRYRIGIKSERLDMLSRKLFANRLDSRRMRCIPPLNRILRRH